MIGGPSRRTKQSLMSLEPAALVREAAAAQTAAADPSQAVAR